MNREAEHLLKISKNIKQNEPLANHTSFKLGGPADLFLIPESLEELKTVFTFCKKESIETFIIGKGTNLLIGDKGIRGLVIKIADSFRKYKVSDNLIESESGIDIWNLSKLATENELTGLEFACGIPGTLGGGIIMNAGAYGGEIKDILIKTIYLNSSGEIEELNNLDHNFKYRNSSLQGREGIILKSILKLKKSNKAQIESKVKEFTNLRNLKQPLDMPSAGSVFKRPEGFFAGKLIEDCELKGFKIGGAEISKVHSGFIVNRGAAKPIDVLKLINYIKDVVKRNFNINLETEVKILGEFYN